MAEETSTDITEVNMNLALEEDVKLYLLPPSKGGSVSVSLRYNLVADKNTISHSTLSQFCWRKVKGRRCPKIGDRVTLEMRRPRYGLGIDLEFEVSEDPTTGVIIGAPACRMVLQTWTSD